MSLKRMANSVGGPPWLEGRGVKTTSKYAMPVLSVSTPRSRRSRSKSQASSVSVTLPRRIRDGSRSWWQAMSKTLASRSSARVRSPRTRSEARFASRTDPLAEKMMTPPGSESKRAAIFRSEPLRPCWARSSSLTSLKPTTTSGAPPGGMMVSISTWKARPVRSSSRYNLGTCTSPRSARSMVRRRIGSVRRGWSRSAKRVPARSRPGPAPTRFRKLAFAIRIRRPPSRITIARWSRSKISGKGIRLEGR